MLFAATTVTQSTTSLVVLALIAGICAILAASVPIVVNGRQNRKMRIEDWQRQDAVAERVVEAAEAAKAEAERAAKVAEEQKAASAKLEEKLTEIAHQTDGMYTEALESELRALEGQAATLREVVALRAASDSDIDSTRTFAVIEQNEARMAELTEGLIRRREYQAKKRTPPRPMQVEVMNVEPVPVDVVLPVEENVPVVPAAEKG